MLFSKADNAELKKYMRAAMKYKHKNNTKVYPPDFSGDMGKYIDV